VSGRKGGKIPPEELDIESLFGVGIFEESATTDSER